MLPVSVVGVFCEDIREEKSGNITLIGVIPDNVEVPSIPVGIPKLCVYIRSHFDPSMPIRVFKHKIILPDQTKLDADSDLAVVAKAQADALEAGTPICAIFARIEMSPFPVTMLGRVRVETTLNDTTYLACALNFKLPVEKAN